VEIQTRQWRDECIDLVIALLIWVNMHGRNQDLCGVRFPSEHSLLIWTFYLDSEHFVVILTLISSYDLGCDISILS